MDLRIGQFNLENLFNRYHLLERQRGARTGKPLDPEAFVREGGNINMLGWQVEDFDTVSSAQRKATAKVIARNAPDILAVQEVENQFALESFARRFLKGMGYTYAAVIDGNDHRQIDVGILSRFPITHLRSHKWLVDGGGERIFARDCLEIDVSMPKGPLTLFVNHFKSKIGGGAPHRAAQAEAVAGIVEDRFDGTRGKLYAVIGDLNMEADEPEFAALAATPLYNLLDALPPEERWTHAWTRSKKRVEYRQSDHLLASPALKNALRSLHIERRGLPQEATRFTGKRFANVKGKGTEASDHCAVFADFEL